MLLKIVCAVVCIVCVVGGRASGESARREMGVGAFRLGFACLSVCLSGNCIAISV